MPAAIFVVGDTMLVRRLIIGVCVAVTLARGVGIAVSQQHEPVRRSGADG